MAAAVIVFFQWRFDADEEPTLTIEASDPGATASAVERTIAIPIEQQISGVEHLRQLHSHCRRDGSYTLIASFAAGTDLNLAQVLVQNRVALALPILPEETQRLGVTLFKRSPDPLMFIVLFSPDGSRDTSYLVNVCRSFSSRTNWLACLVSPRSHSSAVTISAVRVELDPERLAARSLTFDDVTRALKQHDVEAAADQPGAPRRCISPRAERSRRADAAGATRGDRDQGRPGRPRDPVARRGVGPGTRGRVRGLREPRRQGRSGAAIYPVVHASRAEVSEFVRARLSELRPRFPEGLGAFTGFDFSREPTSEAPGTWCSMSIRRPVPPQK